VGATEFSSGTPKSPLHNLLRGGKGHRRSISQAPEPLPKTDPWRKETGWNPSGCCLPLPYPLLGTPCLAPKKQNCSLLQSMASEVADHEAPPVCG